MRDAEYIVYLPGKEQKRTQADSESQAVTQYLVRTLGESQARIQASILKKERHRLNDYAVILPDLTNTDGTRPSQHDLNLLQPHLLARELGSKFGEHPDNYFNQARYLLEASK